MLLTSAWLVIGISAATLPGSVASARPADQSAATSAAPESAKPKKICRTEEVTGSIMPKRSCRTRADWDAQTAGESKKAGDTQRAVDQGSLYASPLQPR